MNSKTSILLLLLMLGFGRQAQAGDMGAMVLSDNDDAMDGSHVMCQHRIEGTLRQLGFTVMDNHRDPCTADLVVVLGRKSPTKTEAVPITYLQPVRLVMMKPEAPVDGEEDCRSGRMVGRKLAEIKLEGRSKSNRRDALQDACRLLDREVKERALQAMGAKLAHKRAKTTLTLRWQNRLQPMPLLKTTTFLQDFLGAPPDLLSSDRFHCRYQFYLDDPHGVFKERMQRFLMKHWAIQASGGDPNRGKRELEFRLAAKKD